MRLVRPAFLLPLLAAGAASLNAADPTPIPPAEMPPLKVAEEAGEKLGPAVFETDFETGSADRFEPTDSKAWKVVKQGDNHVYALTVRVSDYKPPFRSPHNIALIKDVDLAGPTLDVRLQSAMTDYNHRSLCLFFNYQDPSHFYYVHFGKTADPHANQVFIVNGADRKAISLTTTKGTPWDDQWHHARVVRDAETGDIMVYFDDMQKPAMTANDKTFTSGRVGIGSFDDAGSYDRVAVYGMPTE